MNISLDHAQGVVLLADQASERALVVSTLLRQIHTPPLRVIQCSSAAECLWHLDATTIRPRLLVAHYELADGPLLPTLQRWHGARRLALPQLIIWAPAGMLSLIEYQGFITEHQAIVFSFPIDLDAFLGVARSFTLPAWLSKPHTAPLAHCGWLCRRRHACVREALHCHAPG